MDAEDPPVEVSAAAVAAAYSHVGAIEAILEGMMREDAFALAAVLFYVRFTGGLRLGDRREGDWREFCERIVHPAGLFLPGPRGPELCREWLNGPRWTGYCLASSAEQQRDRLRGGGGQQPLVRLPGSEAGRLAWLEETVRRFATGGAPLPACARGARDQHLGRPRQRREPMAEAALLGEVRGALENAWSVLRPLRIPGRPGGWMLAPHRPRVHHAEGWVLPQPGRDPADPATHAEAFEDLARRAGCPVNGPGDGESLLGEVAVAAVEAVAGLAGERERR